jgi:outer membrane protein OmpA-like peptidoglycan-associated protein
VRARRAWSICGPGAAALAALAAWPAGAGAQARGPSLELGVYGGAFLPDDEHEFYDPRDSAQQPLEPVGPELGLRIAFLPLRFVGIEGEADILPQATDSGGSVMLFGARGHLVLQWPATVTPFVLGGAGTMGVRSPARELSDDFDTVAHAGVGAKIRLGDRFALRVEGRGLRAPRADGDGAVNHFAALLGASVTLGRARRERPVTLDLDADGIADAADACPRRAGAPPDGCPEPPDRDRDGLADVDDRCPAAAETENEFEDEDGCPDELPDRDGDRLVDRLDSCTDEPEDADGFQDEDGCPDDDNDGDRLTDRDDRCPLQAGPAANQGCPDADRDADSVVDRLDNCPGQAGQPAHQGCTSRQLVVITPDRLRLLDPITFTTNRTRIRRRSLRVLDNVAAVLTQHAELSSIRIAGHTDDRGGAAHNKTLSQGRAEQVKQYLVGRGVAAERLEAIGHGEERPIRPNTRAAGRAMNRRVELEIAAPAAPTAPAGPAPAGQ